MFKKHGLGTTTIRRSPNEPPPPDYLPPQKEAKPSQVSVVINGRMMTVPANQTILAVCQNQGIYIPTLCHHPALAPTGRCGVCVVHVDRKHSPFVQACKTVVEEGMVIQTQTPDVVYRSQVNLREFLGTRTLESLERTAEIEDLIKFATLASTPDQRQQYCIVRDQALCVSCTRCVRACSGIQDMNILSIDPERTYQPISFERDLPLHATKCIACGQCTAVCPTGAVKERSDVAPILAELCKTGADRKTLILQTAPAGRLSVGELFGDAPGETPVEKVVAAARACGFDLVFDTCFAADTCTSMEAAELFDRLRTGGPFPMFTSCCPAWINLVEKRYPHLRPLLSTCKSPMMMLGAMVRSWMVEENKVDRSRYVLVALMPCVAKKEEIIRPEFKDPQGNQDVDYVLTVREMAKLIKARGVDWQSLPGKHKQTYDPPFAVSSGGGALFGGAGGVTEAVLRVAYTSFTKEIPTDPTRTLFADCRRGLANAPWYDGQLDVTPGRKHKRFLDSAIIHGVRNIQQFLRNLGLDEGVDGFTRQGTRLFVECMSCPGGCLGGGGQPLSLDDKVLVKRRKAIQRVDVTAEHISAVSSQSQFQKEKLGGLASLKARTLLHYEPPLFFNGRSQSSTPGARSELHLTAGSESATIANLAEASCQLGSIVVLYGSQGGFTASYAKHLVSMLRGTGSTGGETGICSAQSLVTLVPMDHFPFKQLPLVSTLVILTSTWENEDGLMPQNAKRFWQQLLEIPLSTQGSAMIATKFAICGFGSPRYTHFCGFASQLHEVLARFGAHPFLDLVKIDVDRTDRGRKPFLKWCRRISASLEDVCLPAPNFLFVPSITPGGKSAPSVSLPGFHTLTVSRVQEYRESGHSPQVGCNRFFYVEFDAGKGTSTASAFADMAPDQYIRILPRNNAKDVESLVNSLYPNMLNTSVSLVPTSTKGGETLPPHLTIRQLFEQFVDISGKPKRWLVQQLDSLLQMEAESGKQQLLADSGLSREILEDSARFARWAEDKTVCQLLKWFKPVVPSIEVLLAMLPLMRPRCYTPIHHDQSPEGSGGKLGTVVGVCVKFVDKGLCSRFLTNCKKGDKVLCSVGHSYLPRPNDAFMALLRPATDSSSGALITPNASQAKSSSGMAIPSPGIVSSRTSTPMGSPRKSHDTGSPVQVSPSPGMTSPQIDRGAHAKMGNFPLTFNISRLFSNLDRVPVDEAVCHIFDLSNLQKDKYRFTFHDVENEKFKLSFDPAAGVIKPRYTVVIKASLVVFCTTTFTAEIKVSCEPASKRGEDGESLRSTIPLVVETRLSPKLDYDEFRFIEEIGSGVFGVVHRGEWRGQEVAIKVLRSELRNIIGQSSDFARECKLLQELRCPYIVSLIGYCTMSGRQSLVTEYMPLGNLTKHIREGKLSMEFKLKAAHNCAKGLAFLHHCGVIHRDLKPDNILLASLDATQPIVAKISDFGTSRDVQKIQQQQERSYTRGIGTPIYMSPEVLQGAEYALPADVFSFAILLWELFVGKTPYSTPEFTQMWCVAQFVTSGKRLGIPPEVPPRVAQLIRSCWEQDPAKRPTFHQVAEALVPEGEPRMSPVLYAEDARMSSPKWVPGTTAAV